MKSSIKSLTYLIKLLILLIYLFDGTVICQNQSELGKDLKITKDYHNTDDFKLGLMFLGSKIVNTGNIYQYQIVFQSDSKFYSPTDDTIQIMNWKVDLFDKENIPILYKPQLIENTIKYYDIIIGLIKNNKLVSIPNSMNYTESDIDLLVIYNLAYINKLIYNIPSTIPYLYVVGIDVQPKHKYDLVPEDILLQNERKFDTIFNLLIPEGSSHKIQVSKHQIGSIHITMDENRLEDPEQIIEGNRSDTENSHSTISSEDEGDTYYVKLIEKNIFNPEYSPPEELSTIVNRFEFENGEYELPESLKDLWRLDDNSKQLKYKNWKRYDYNEVRVERNTYDQKIEIVNAYSKYSNSGFPDGYYVTKRSFEPINKKTKQVDRDEFKKYISPNAPDKFSTPLPKEIVRGDSSYLIIEKPFGYNITDENIRMVEYTDWKKPSIFIDLILEENRYIPIHWVKLLPVEMFYIDMSNTNNRDDVAKELYRRLDFIVKSGGEFIVYFSNQSTPLIYSTEDGINQVIRTLRSIKPMVPNIKFDIDEFIKYISVERRPVNFNFYLSETMYDIDRLRLLSRILINKFNIHYGINEDQIDEMLNIINKKEDIVSINLYLENVSYESAKEYIEKCIEKSDDIYFENW